MPATESKQDIYGLNAARQKITAIHMTWTCTHMSVAASKDDDSLARSVASNRSVVRATLLFAMHFLRHVGMSTTNVFEVAKIDPFLGPGVSEAL